VNNVIVLRNAFDVVYETKGTECVRVFLPEGVSIPEDWEEWTMQAKDEWLFENQDYGFVFNLGSQLRKEVNATLVKLKFSGYLEQLKTKWFSSGSNQIRMHFSACSSILFLSFF
jgi:hypothetical protein